MSCPFYKFDGGWFGGDYYCIKQEKAVDSDTYYKYCRNYDYKDCPIYKHQSSSSGCFLTSACTAARGLPDDCHELTVLRNFRDNWLKNQPDGSELISAYYKIAPMIVKCIDAREDRQKYWDLVYDTVQTCVEFIEAEMHEEALKAYQTLTLALKSFCINNMTEQELLDWANMGDIDAIEAYVGHLNDTEQQRIWLRKGAQAGSPYCTEMHAALTTAIVHNVVNMDPAEAGNRLRDLCEAEEWVLSLRNAGKLENESVLSGSYSLYSEMVWCHHLIAETNNDSTHHKEVIRRYKMIAAVPASRETYAYIQALHELGEIAKAMEISFTLLESHDDTVKNYMMEVVCLQLADAYFLGSSVQPDYMKSCSFVREAAKYNPDCKSLDYIKSGEAWKAFNATHRSTTPATNTSSSGCYVATAVYGSYDCPQVWTLRRFRDDVLAKSFAGRLFIRTYYAISPTLVKWFGHCNWFRNLWKPTLDRMVARLNANGTEDTPYQDRSW